VEPIRGKRLKARYIQAWADAVDFTKKSITVEDAVLDPEQGMLIYYSVHSTVWALTEARIGTHEDYNEE
jgi:hypothetical protein